MHNDVERSVLDHEVFSNGERSVTLRQARELISSGYYRKSTGNPYGAAHFRRTLGDGSCLHLVVEGRRGRLHHDAFDPHTSAYSLAMHLTHEARSEAAVFFALTWSVLRLLSR